MTAPAIVLDTNIVLDVFVFSDEAAAPLKQALQAGSLRWLATPAMRDELARVLTYPHIVRRLVFYQLQAADVLSAFDRYAHLTEVAPKASVSCRDADDQKFIDLAVAHRTQVLSKDAAVLCMAKRMRALGANAQARFGELPRFLAAAVAVTPTLPMASADAQIAFS